MRFFYASPHLSTNIGHSANYLRALKQALAVRNIETIVLASTSATEELQRELDAIPFFTMSGDWSTDGDPVSGWLNAFDRGGTRTAEDFARLVDIRSDDMVYLKVLWPAQILGLGTWLRSVAPHDTPTAVVEFVVGAGLAVQEDQEGLSLGFPDPQVDSRALLYRFVAHKFRSEPAARIQYATWDERCSEIYAGLLGTDVHTLPWPYETPQTLRQRRKRDGIVVATLGYQRLKKGYNLVPEIVARLLHDDRNAQVLVHNCAAEESPEVQQALRGIAHGNPRLSLNESAVGAAAWNELLDTSDIIVCPYHPAPYVNSHSAIVAEAMSRGIPLVVPAGTVLSACLERFGWPGVAFAGYSASAIKDAIQIALNQFDQLAARAHEAAQTWNKVNGPRQFVDAVLKIAAAANPRN